VKRVLREAVLLVGCQTQADLPADWYLEHGAKPSATVIDAFVKERACSGGRTADGRVQQPTVAYGRTAVTITFRVRKVDGSATCQGVLPTRYRVRLKERLGARVLRNGRDGRTVTTHAP
jgi:hypothetical protein